MLPDKISKQKIILSTDISHNENKVNAAPYHPDAHGIGCEGIDRPSKGSDMGYNRVNAGEEPFKWIVQVGLLERLHVLEDLSTCKRILVTFVTYPIQVSV